MAGNRAFADKVKALKDTAQPIDGSKHINLYSFKSRSYTPLPDKH
jgi:hypothetical protein